MVLPYAQLGYHSFTTVQISDILNYQVCCNLVTT